MVLLSGEPGIGKSRLLAALEERLASEPHVRLRYFCSPHHQDSAAAPGHRASSSARPGSRASDPPEARLAKLEALLRAGLDAREDVALLAELLSLPAGERYPPLDLTPAAQAGADLRGAAAPARRPGAPAGRC